MLKLITHDVQIASLHETSNVCYVLEFKVILTTEVNHHLETRHLCHFLHEFHSTLLLSQKIYHKMAKDARKLLAVRYKSAIRVVILGDLPGQY